MEIFILLVWQNYALQALTKALFQCQQSRSNSDKILDWYYCDKIYQINWIILIKLILKSVSIANSATS